MAYNPYNLTRVAPPAAPAAGGGRYALTRQPSLTANGQEEEAQNLQGLRTGQFADVQSAATATQRANAMRTSQGLQAARGTVARAGDMSPEAAIRAQDQALAQSSAQNLNADNQVNQMQRQYHQDALNRASDIENRADTQAGNERAYQTDADRYATDQAWKGYQANTDQENNLFGQNFQLQQADRAQSNTNRDYSEGVRRYDLGRGDQNSQFAQTFGANRADAAFGQGLQKDEFNANRSDTAWNQQNTVSQQADNRSRFDLTRGDQNSQFAQTFGANRQDAAFSQGLQTNEFNANRSDTAWNQQNTESQQADSRSRFDLTRGDQNNQFNQTFGANREDAATAKDQFGQTLAQRQSEFGVTSGQNQQQIDNQASQAAASLGYNYASLTEQQKEYFQNMAQRQSEFGVTSGQNQQQIDNQANQFGVTSGQNQQQIDNQANQFGVTSGQNQQQINNQASQASAVLADSQNKFNLTRGDQLAETKYQQGRDTKGDQMAAINAIQDPKARQAAYDTYMKGGDVSQFITGTLYDQNGGLKVDPATGKSPYASATPGQVEYQSKLDELKSYYPDKTDAEIQQLAQTERAQDHTLSQAPATAAATQLQLADASKRLAAGGQSADDIAKLPPVNPQSIPGGDKVKDWLANNTTGGWANIGGTPYKVTAGGSGLFGDYTILKDQNGTVRYMDTGGKMHDALPSTNFNSLLKGWQ